MIFGWMAVILIAICKTMLDQYTLLRQYRKQVNPSYPIVPGEKPDSADPLGLTTGMRWINIMFSKHPKHPELAKQAKKVRLEFFSTLSLMVGGFILLVMTMAVINRH
jgi:hypothetical protein